MAIPKITRYNDNAVSLYIGYEEWFFSYETLIGYWNGEKGYRTSMVYSRTTSKHVGIMEITGYEKISQEDLEKMADIPMYAKL